MQLLLAIVNADDHKVIHKIEHYNVPDKYKD